MPIVQECNHCGAKYCLTRRQRFCPSCSTRGSGERPPAYYLSKSMKDRIRRQYGHCVGCELERSACIERFQNDLHIHHLCPKHESCNPAVFNSERNLVPLCNSCHSSWESHTPGPPEGIGMTDLI